MADEKKDKKEKSKGLSPVELILFWFFVFLLLGRFLSGLTGVFGEGRGISVTSKLSSFFVFSVVPLLKSVSIGISILSVLGLIWSVRSLTKINREQKSIYDPLVLVSAPGQTEQKKNIRWERVVEHINSPNPNDWKFAILEADIILDDLLNTMGYKGETMADKLKTIEKSDFLTLDAAWEAHKIRNQIAHEGADFLVTEREARRVVSLFEAVFKEFHFI